MFKYTSERYMSRWHAAATERFERLQAMDSDDFVDGVDDELKYERDVFQERLVNVNGTQMLVTKAPFFEGEAGVATSNGEVIPGPPVEYTRVLGTEEMKRLERRQQARYDELYGKERVEKQNQHAAMETGEVDLELDELIENHTIASRRAAAGGGALGNNTRGGRRRRDGGGVEVGVEGEGPGEERFKIRDKVAVFEKNDWPDESSDKLRRTDGDVGSGGYEEGDSDLDFPVTLPYEEHGRARGAQATGWEERAIADGGRGCGGAGVRVGAECSLLGQVGSLPWSSDGLLMSKTPSLFVSKAAAPNTSCTPPSRAGNALASAASVVGDRAVGGGDAGGAHMVDEAEEVGGKGLSVEAGEQLGKGWHNQQWLASDSDAEVQWWREQVADECSCVDKSESAFENEILDVIRHQGAELFPCATSGYGSRVMLKDKRRLQLQYAVNDLFWQAAHHGDAPEAARLLALGAEVNLQVWVHELDAQRNEAHRNEPHRNMAAATQQGAAPQAEGQAGGEQDGEAGEGAVLKWCVAAEEQWGNTPLDRLVKFGGPHEWRLVAEVVCAFVKGGERSDADKVQRAVKTNLWRQAAARILEEMQGMPEAWPFLRPVTEEEAPGYYHEIALPMDLGTVEAKLRSGHYQSPRAWQADLRLMVANALQYNRPKDLVYKLAMVMARALEAKVEADVVLKAEVDRAAAEEEEEQRVREGEGEDDRRRSLRVAEGWEKSVPPPINHTLFRLHRLARHRARVAARVASLFPLSLPLCACVRACVERESARESESEKGWGGEWGVEA